MHAPARARRLTISPANYVDDDVAMTMCIDASDVSLQSVDRASVLKRLMMMRRRSSLCDDASTTSRRTLIQLCITRDGLLRKWSILSRLAIV